MAASVKVEGIVLGLALLGLGTVCLLANLGRVDLLHTLRTWWPLTLIVWGALELYQAFVARARGRNLPAGQGPRWD
jgi:cell wall-active antibiotic response 4TMS protein YvqF